MKWEGNEKEIKILDYKKNQLSKMEGSKKENEEQKAVRLTKNKLKKWHLSLSLLVTALNVNVLNYLF